MAARRKEETRAVGDLLTHLNHLEGVYAWRNNTGVAEDPQTGRIVKFSEEGAADVLCCLMGRFVAFEGKSSRGKQSDAQKRWQTSIEAAGGIYILFRTVPEALAQAGVSPDHPRRPDRRRVFPR